jgi:glycosyltransferase involved in cell wall biosynthesis
VALAERLGVADHVRMRGTLHEMGGFYREIDILLAPSLREPFGLVSAEAMVHGVPVVAAAVDGVPEVVEDGETGICIAPSLDLAAYEQIGGSDQGLPPRCYDPIGDRLRAPMALDPERVVDAVVKILGRPDRYREMGVRGRDRVQRLFDAERYTSELSMLLIGLAGE